VKRVAIARALAIGPQLIFYDEPTSELDPLSAAAIVEDIVKLNQRIQATTVVVTHDRELAFGIGRHVAMLEDGRIIAAGTPDEIRHNPDPRVQEFVTVSIVHAPPVSAAC
jgi:phospholipid/cholesterol/gamma-HCH transport system ATP-binding protein